MFYMDPRLPKLDQNFGHLGQCQAYVELRTLMYHEFFTLFDNILTRLLTSCISLLLVTVGTSWANKTAIATTRPYLDICSISRGRECVVGACRCCGPIPRSNCSGWWVAHFAAFPLRRQLCNILPNWRVPRFLVPLVECLVVIFGQWLVAAGITLPVSFCAPH